MRVNFRRFMKAVSVVLSVLWLASCASGPSPKDLAPTKCRDTENGVAEFPDVIDDSGETIVALHFRCSYQKADTTLPAALNPKNHEAELKKAGGNLRKITQIESRYESAQEKYLKGKCPKDWTGEVVWEPFGWKCYSEELPLTKACARGKPIKLENKSGKKELVCVTNPKFYPKEM